MNFAISTYWSQICLHTVKKFDILGESYIYGGIMPDMTGHEIRVLRKSWNMSQQEFASLWGVSYRWLWGVEKENKTPERIYQLALETIIRQREGRPLSPDPPLAYAA
jgi:DNA-binding XRE family transcriptional regulator